MRNEIATLLVVTICFASVSSSITFYILSPKPSQSFMTIGVYSGARAQGYVSNSTVRPGQTLNWTIFVTNRMGTAQFVMVIARVGNEANVTSPDTTAQATYSNGTALPQAVASGVFVGDDDTVSLSFIWTLQNITQSTSIAGQTVYRLGLVANRQSTLSPVVAVNGQNFRWIFELWTFDLSTHNFHYGYGPQTAPTGSWLQIWFNAQP